MEHRSFGGATRVSVLGVGCSRVGSISNPVPMREIKATLGSAIEAGINLFDTADIYGQGDSERTLGRLLRRYRDQMFVTTKVGHDLARYAAAIRIAKPLLRGLVRSRSDRRSAVLRARAGAMSQNFSPQRLRRAVEGSRRRLGLDRLDALLLHNPSVETLRDPEIHDFLAELVHSGQAAQVGASVESHPEVEAALSVPITILQIPVAVANALSGTAILEHIRRRNIGVFVREILSGPIPRSRPSREAVSAAIAPDFVAAAIIGVSTRRHLNELLSAVS
jgi:aryl-alcohol dehydrogenase-like predicted oxidoreductase